MPNKELNRESKKVEKKEKHLLTSDFPTKKKAYKKGDTILLTEKGATYLRTLKKIK